MHEEFSKRVLPETRMIHFAPEPFLSKHFKTLPLKIYETADLHMKGVDHQVDLCDLPFGDDSYDIVYASHILEHIPDDRQALAEISRILSPAGVAVLPVPVVVEQTIEYGKANPLEEYHVRAPGADYFHRYSGYFSSVKVLTSDDFPAENQVYIHEDRENFPNKICPDRTAMHGDIHLDYLPLCYT